MYTQQYYCRPANPLLNQLQLKRRSRQVSLSIMIQSLRRPNSRLPNELIGRTEILRGKVYLVGQAPTGTYRPKTTILYDKRYPAEAFNHEEYYQVQAFPHDATPEQLAPYQEMIEAVKIKITVEVFALTTQLFHFSRSRGHRRWLLKSRAT